MRAGELRHPISIVSEEGTEEPDGRGGFTADLSEKENIRWAKIEPISTAEKSEYKQSKMKVTHRITVRGPQREIKKGITIKHHRESTEDRLFEVTGIRDIKEKGEKIEIEAVETRAGDR